MGQSTTMRRQLYLLCIFHFQILLEDGSCITTPRRRLPIPHWNFDETDSDIFDLTDGRLDFTRNIRNYQEPPLPWEDALRHSVYLTLVRDKIDVLLKKNGITDRRRHPNKEEIDRFEQEIQKDSDVNLWKDIKRAPFKLNGKPKGPVFGDIAILSRGRLVQNEDGYQFIQDDNVEECIECHLYSARPNELEAEKMFACRGEDCNNRGLKALWTVRRIRHRNYDTGNPPFRYELMFSISSAKQDGQDLNYNIPSQTFTISEDDKLIKKEGKRKGKFLEGEKVNKRPSGGGAIQFPDSRPSHVPSGFLENPRDDLNIGEVLLDNNRAFQTRQPKPIINHDVHPSGDFNNFNVVKKDPENYENLPTITHLHHHFYLNDQGLPMIFEKNYNHDTVIENMQRYHEVTTNAPENFPVREQAVSSTENPNYTENRDDIGIFENPPSTQAPARVVTIGEFRKPRKRPLSTTQVSPTKPFRPSPVDIRTIYSEPDPLYTSTNPQIQEEEIIVTTPTTAEESKDDDNVYYASTISDPTTEIFTTIVTPAATTIETKTTTYKRHKLYSTRKPIVTKNQKIKKVEPEITTTNVETTQIVEPKVNKTIEGRRRTLNKVIYKNGRRLKLQKKPSDIINSQVPAPDHVTNTTSPYVVSNTTENIESSSFGGIKILEISTTKPRTTTQSNNEYTTTRKFKNFQSQRNVRRKYLRKPGSYATKRPTTSTTTVSSKTETPREESSLESDVSVAKVEEIPTARKAPPIPRIEEVERPRYRLSQIIATRKDIIVSNDGSNLPNESNETRIEMKDVALEGDQFNVSQHQVVSRKSADYIENEDQIETTTLDLDTAEITTLAPDDNIEDNVTNVFENTETEMQTDVTEIPTTESTTKKSATKPSDDSVTSQTKKSYVTSISLKMGNRTRPFVRPISSSRYRNREVKKEDDFQWMENSTFMTDLMKRFDMDKMKKTKQPRENESEMKVMDNITQKIVHHAKRVNIVNNSTSAP